MARIRTIKPEIMSDERSAGLSDGAFRMFIGLITLADDYGNTRASVPWLTGQIWWARGDSPRVAEFLREIVDSGLVAIYTVRKQAYLHLNGWGKHQRIDNAGKPQVPQLEEAEDCDPDTLAAVRGESPRLAAGPGREEEGDIGGAANAAAAKPKPAKAPKRQAAPLSADWAPTPKHVALAAKERRDLNREADRFRDWAANAKPKVDWDAAFSNWLRSDYGAAAPKASPQSKLVAVGAWSDTVDDWSGVKQ